MTARMTPKDAIELGKKHGAEMVDLRFIDLPGTWQHTSVPFKRLDADAFEDGFGFDGSSIRGYADQRVRHADHARGRDRADGPVHEAPDARAPLQHRRPDHARALRPRPALHRAQG
jgi:glutamine synthetase